MNRAGGIPAYIKALDESMENNYQGWLASKAGEEAPKQEKPREVYEHKSKDDEPVNNAADKLANVQVS